jgi:MoaA/NifB/PqqE/SkfB family radical SAM enzyme
MLSFSPVWSWHRPSFLSPDELNNLRLSLAGLRKRLNWLSLRHNLEEALLRYKIGEAVCEKYPCYIAWYHTRIRVNGDVIPCQRCDLPMGNLEESGFGEIWNGTAYRSFRMKTRTRHGVASLSDHCDCRFCCYAADNWKVHRSIRWVLPLNRLIKSFV